jgi:hypothetical protein
LRSNTGPNDPQECDWPMCDCDPHAARVLDALQEMDLMHKVPAPLEHSPCKHHPSDIEGLHAEDVDESYCNGWNACRKAMLGGGK